MQTERITPNTALTSEGNAMGLARKDIGLAHSHQMEELVQNFREAAGPRLLRSANPDELGAFLYRSRLSQLDKSQWPESARTILYDATLIMDLRMDNEIDFSQQESLISMAPGGRFEMVRTLEELVNSNSKRLHFRPSNEYGLTREDLVSYAETQWPNVEGANPSGSAHLHHQLNERGLVGLYEVILEKKTFMQTVLQAMTIHLERNPNGKVLLHCSIGKDRTGLLSMVCQSILGLPDEHIIRNFNESSCIHEVALEKFEEFFHGNVDAKLFAGCTNDDMRRTLAYLRTTYGSVSQYLDSAGFDASWRQRLKRVLTLSNI